MMTPMTNTLAYGAGHKRSWSGAAARAMGAAAIALCMARCSAAQQDVAVALPPGVEAVWDLKDAWSEPTETRERVCINGLWRWQPARQSSATVPDIGWGFFKVPGCWPGIADYMQKDCQTVYAHPNWRDTPLASVTTAWYQREITVPEQWQGRRIVLSAEYVHSFATVFVDGQSVGELRYPAGEVDLTAVCRPGSQHMLSMCVVAMPLKGVMLSYHDTASARQVQGEVARRGLCGDVYLASLPAGPRVSDVKINTSVRQKSIGVVAALEGLADDAQYILRVQVSDGRLAKREFASEPFGKSQLQEGRVTVTASWMPEKLWDIHTPEHKCDLQVMLCDAQGAVLDADLSREFGFREFWIEGRDFYLNGTRIFLSSVPLDNAQVGAAWATYEGARESMRRLASFGINFVYTHNYGCEPGSHLSFDEILRAADDVGMLVALSQPHFSHYEWDAPDADQTNGYAQHAAFYVHVAQNHPSVVAYATSHNATGYGEDMNPDMIDGIQARRSEWAVRNVHQATRAEAIIQRLDPTRIVYHHASGNLGTMHTSNFYANFAPVQEMSDWFEHWSTHGVKPLFTCEYSVPMPWDWTMYRGWYQGKREFGSAVVPWEFCVAEWNAQFFGAQAYRISEEEKQNLRWEAKQFREGRRWHRWDYPHQVGSNDFAERYPVYARYFADNWPAFRAWEVSANSPWNHAHYWTLRPGVDKSRQQLTVNWSQLQRPGYSPDYIQDRYETIDLAFEQTDWIPTVAAETLIRNNRPLLAYIAGKPEALTSKDHLFYPGESFDKQLVVINNSREAVSAQCQWLLRLPDLVPGKSKIDVPTGQQDRIALHFTLPEQLAPGRYELTTSVRFSTGDMQSDSFAFDVMPRPAQQPMAASVALFDPRGETRQLLQSLGVPFREVGADAKLSPSDVLVVGKHALTVEGTAPDISIVRDGLRVIVFEQTPEVLEQRLGFRIATYGLRQLFCRIPDHPVLAGFDDEHLRDWRGEATLVPPRLEYLAASQFSDAPTVRWCGIPVSRVWRCGNRGNVASALIEKPGRGDFRPLLDGGFALQYSPLLEYREGQGLVLLCQTDVTGRTDQEPAAETLVRNMLHYIDAWKPAVQHAVVYVGDPVWKKHFESAGIPLQPYSGGPLSIDQVLVVGPGGGDTLHHDNDAASIRKFLEAGGQLLCLGLDQRDAEAFLPFPLSTRQAEHIAAYFPAPSVNSLLAGVCPADVHNPAPRALPLVSANADVTAIGDGVLGAASQFRVVFCQLPPDSVDPALGRADTPQHNLKRTYRHTCFLVSRLLGNMGVAGTTPLLARFSTPLEQSAGASVVKNGQMSVDSDADGVPDQWQFSSNVKGAACHRESMPGSPDTWSMALDCPSGDAEDKGGPSTMLAQHDVPVTKDQWYRISFRARAEGLAANSVTVTIANTATWKTLFEYQRFEPGAEWQQFKFEVQGMDTSNDKTRFQIWYSGPGKLWISDVRIDMIADPAVGRWLDGFYLDVPEQWDDPYRFFRW